MFQLQMLVPALGAQGRGEHQLWWIVLLVVVFALVMPMAWLFGRQGGKPDTR